MTQIENDSAWIRDVFRREGFRGALWCARAVTNYGPEWFIQTCRDYMPRRQRRTVSLADLKPGQVVELLPPPGEGYSWMPINGAWQRIKV